MKNILRIINKKISLHEFQAANILKKAGLPVLKGEAVDNVQEAVRVASELASGIVIKAQIHGGGRGRGVFKNSQLSSGVHILNNSNSVRELAEKMIGDTLITKQTGKEGKVVKNLYIVERVDIKKEMYLAITIDRENAAATIIASPQGGMGIEEIDKKYIIQLPLKEDQINEEEIEKISNFMQPENISQKNQLSDIVRKIVKTFFESDATLIEVNPLGILKDGRVVICDSKIRIDDNAEFRQKEIFKMEDKSQTDATEIKAKESDLNYIKLKGDIGCLVNGAGLAMATMDLIKFKSGEPANFLDIGGGTTSSKVEKAVQIIDSDPEVKSILVNIFGGIVRCDIVAEGIINSVKNLNIRKPIIMRIKGTNSEEAMNMINRSGLNIFWEDDVDKAVELAISKSKL